MLRRTSAVRQRGPEPLISLFITGLFELSFYSLPILAFLIFPESYPTRLIFQIYWHFVKFVHNTMLLFFWTVLRLLVSFFVRSYFIMSLFSKSSQMFVYFINLSERPTVRLTKLLWFFRCDLLVIYFCLCSYYSLLFP